MRVEWIEFDVVDMNQRRGVNWIQCEYLDRSEKLRRGVSEIYLQRRSVGGLHKKTLIWVNNQKK